MKIRRFIRAMPKQADPHQPADCATTWSRNGWQARIATWRRRSRRQAVGLFPKLDDLSGVLKVLRAGDGHLLRLAAHLGVTPSWTGIGLEYHCFPNGVTDLFCCAETTQVSFIAEDDTNDTPNN
jgi:hypothetical protein